MPAQEPNVLDRRHHDPVADAEAMATTHLRREHEVRRVASLVRWMDDLVRVPGTRFGFGLDPLLGLFLPGVGDAVTGLVAMTLLVTAVRRGVPRVVVARMLLNIGIDTVVGLVPLAGDVFDAAWRANVRNLALLERYQGDLSPGGAYGELEPRARTSDYLMIGAAAVLVVASVAAPLALLWWLLASLVG